MFRFIEYTLFYANLHKCDNHTVILKYTYADIFLLIEFILKTNVSMNLCLLIFLRILLLYYEKKSFMHQYFSIQIKQHNNIL